MKNADHADGNGSGSLLAGRQCGSGPGPQLTIHFARGNILATQRLAVPAGASRVLVKYRDFRHREVSRTLVELDLPAEVLSEVDARRLLTAGERFCADYEARRLRVVMPIKGIVCAPGSPIEATIAKVRCQAASKLSLLLQGEKGVGKSAIGRYGHALSGRAGQYVHVSCALLNSSDSVSASMLDGLGRHHGLPNAPAAGQDGLLLKSHNGTMHLDDAEQLSWSTQGLLLSVVDNGEYRRLGGEAEVVRVNVRFIFSTNQDVEDLVAKGKLRADLRDRIWTIALTIPPLRERREDIPVLIDYFSKRNGDRVRYARDLFLAMLWHDWPDNVRGVQNLVEATSVWPGPGLLKLSDLDGLCINPKIIQALRKAFGRYELAAKAAGLGPREAKLARLVFGVSRAVFQQVFHRMGQMTEPPVSNWREVLDGGLERLRDRLPLLGFKASALPAGGTCWGLLKAGGVEDAVIRRTLCQVLKWLHARDVHVSSQHERPRYRILQRFFGLTNSRLRYHPRRLKGGSNV